MARTKALKFARAAASIVVVLLAAACADSEVDQVSAINPEGNLFQQALYRGYLHMAGVRDGKDAYATEFYTVRARVAGQGQTVLPEEPDPSRIPLNVPAENVGELTRGHDRLTRLLDGNARTAQPEVAATAQVAYDCWLVETAVRAPGSLISECRAEFFAAVAQLEGR